jgi:putative Ig domain-containing protein
MNPQRHAGGLGLTRAATLTAVAALLFSGAGLAVRASTAQGSSKLQITTKSLPNATVGVEYYAVLAARGGEPPYDFSGTGLPPGLAFHPMSDTLGGKATTPGTYSVVITVNDSTMPASQSASASFKLTVVAAK